MGSVVHVLSGFCFPFNLHNSIPLCLSGISAQSVLGMRIHDANKHLTSSQTSAKAGGGGYLVSSFPTPPISWGYCRNGWLLGRKWKAHWLPISTAWVSLSVALAIHSCNFFLWSVCNLPLHWSVWLDGLCSTQKSTRSLQKQLLRVVLHSNTTIYLLIFLLIDIAYLCLCKYVWSTLYALFPTFSFLFLCKFLYLSPRAQATIF